MIAARLRLKYLTYLLYKEDNKSNKEEKRAGSL
jgi:hypothetical protein